ncbi:WecB/TagA/CpsF family glycosyltransferase [Amedibacillus dolichus]|uniref:WecB/TagA/CpsF family glycosyltransferase n=1 Tax=Amedibacillus dolichus TaxID=31971 RepID=UPI002941BE4D|nr:WecB/TagA/CpsF family glycosyltransferase [Amedibacillus dolichus]
MNEPERIKIIGVDISVVNFDLAQKYLFDNFDLARGGYICAANVHTTVTAHEDKNYRKVQNSSFMTLPDGKPLSVVGKKRGKSSMERVTGPDFLEEVLKRTENTEFKHYFYGTTQENLDNFISTIKRNYQNLKIAGAEPSVFRSLSNEEEDELIKRINESGADFVWIALGAPRQEIFCNKLAERTNAVWIAVGGAFNVISGVIPRAPQWMQDHGLEWFYRLAKEPGRLFKRYFVTNTKFLWYLFKEKGVK